MPRHADVHIASLMAATDVDVLPEGTIVEDRGPYVLVRSSGNPGHYWGNFLLWREPPAPGDRERWEAAFEREFRDQPASVHRAFGIDGPCTEEAAAEFAAAGYEVMHGAALVAEPHELAAHARANTEVEVRELDPAEGADADLWAAAVEVHTANREPGHEEGPHRAYTWARMAERRARFTQGDGGWFVALTPQGEVAASCGVVVTEGRARFQSVDTAEAHRSRGIASRLVHDVGRAALDRFGAEQLVIGADAEHHAFSLYQSLGFVVRERTVELCWWPTSPTAAMHPTYGHLARRVD
ncbi:MAG: hypothetical protein JWM98_3151 [Thermoleophilia bacterium]|nr:hypothetical protein [Thermoleophilia bacterium]